MNPWQCEWRLGHSFAHYQAAAYRRNAEIFADFVALAGESRLGARLAEQFAPRFYAETMKALKDMPSAHP